ncbi:hypothetical protein CWI42_021130 [Ordospora colligata]|nr:hypothetical protein CWI42_021130 [Ordospora colligata]
MEKDAFAKRFVDAYRRRKELHNLRRMACERINKKMVDQQVLRRAIEKSKGMNTSDLQQSQTEQAAIFGTGAYRLSLIEIGRLPTEDPERFHTETAIYPIGYACRKKYRGHDTYNKRSRDRILYICSVDAEKGPVIMADDGREWHGPGMWEQFVNSIGNVVEYKNMEEFFGFINPMLAKKIESLGDVSICKRYIPWNKRAKLSSM